MANITLSEAKMHCRIDESDTLEDSLLQVYINAALSACQKHIGKTFDDGLEFTDDIKAGCLMLIGHLYENRQNVNIGNITSEIPFTSAYLWNMYRDPAIY